MDTLLQKAKASASAHNLKWAKDGRVSRTPGRFWETTVLEDRADSGDSKWRRESFEEVDLMHAEIQRRFEQDGMATAAKREKVLLDAAKGNVSDLSNLQLPPQTDTASLDPQLKMLGGLTKQQPSRTFKMCHNPQDGARCCNHGQPHLCALEEGVTDGAVKLSSGRTAHHTNPNPEIHVVFTSQFKVFAANRPSQILSFLSCSVEVC